MGLTDNSVYWHYSWNNWNKNTHKNFKNSSQEITLHLYIQYSGLIALSTLRLVLSSAHTGLEHSTSQIHSHTRSTLCSSSAKSPSLSAIHCPHSAMSHTLNHYATTVPHLTVCWPYMLLIHCLRPSLLFQLALHISFSSSIPDVRGYMGHYNTRCCCPLLQYFPVGYAILRHLFYPPCLFSATG